MGSDLAEKIGFLMIGTIDRLRFMNGKQQQQSQIKVLLIEFLFDSWFVSWSGFVASLSGWLFELLKGRFEY